MQSKFVLLFLIVLNLHQIIFAQKLTKEDCKCKIKSLKRLLGGETSAPNAYPFHVSLVKKAKSNEAYCAGVILNHNQILTKARCVMRSHLNTNDILIRAGIHDLNSKEGETYTIKKVIRDNRYDFPNDFYTIGDLAVIFTNEAINFTDKIQPGCLGKLEESDKKSPLKIIGWNPTVKDEIMGTNSGVLKEAKVYYKKELYSYTDCFNHVICYRSYVNQIINISDGGSALILEKNGITKIIGINKFTNHESNAGAEKIEFYKPELDKWTENNYCSVDL